MSSLGPGGAERVMVRVAGLLAKSGFDVSILPVLNADASVAPDIHPEVRIDHFEGEHYFSILRPFKKVFLEKKFWLFFNAFFLSIKNVFKVFCPLISYIKKNSPDLILTAHYNSPVIFAARLAKTRTKVVVTEHILLSSHFARFPWAVRKFYSCSCRFFYPRADKIIGVSQSVIKDLQETGYAPPEKLACIYNPVAAPYIEEMAAVSPAHPWLPSTIERPVFVATGQLNQQKDYPTLLKALALLRRRADARLVVLGRGALLQELQSLSKDLAIEDSIDWLGFVPNPFAYMKNSGFLVLSSTFEGLPTVIIEALALGISVAATDSLGGIREILGDGEYGRLVPVGDYEALANAMYENLRKPFDKKFLQARANLFSEENARSRYESLIKDLLA
ncbi:MAG: glycosyltransferase [Synergistaceae bacterium]|jgi:glycosyltransferase involved in cell wall biosynthesis|nr:glycosyltransferase [Synergistaceae bacterium]